MTVTYLGKTYKLVEEADVIASFKEALDILGEVTSLEVKDDLRDKDFWVGQDFVSDTLANYVKQNPGVYLVTYENGHKVYSLDWSGSLPASTITSTPKAKKAAKQGEYMTSCPSLTNKMTGDGPVEVYSNVTRNAARYAFAKKYGVDYTEVTAKKIGE